MLQASVQVAGPTASATLLNTQANKQFSLQITAHKDGIVRVLIDEPGVQRYKITDLVMPQVDGLKTDWQSSKDTQRLTLTSGSTSITLSFQPFKLAVSQNDKPTLLINGRGMFNYEHRRAKDEVRATDSNCILRQMLLAPCHTDENVYLLRRCVYACACACACTCVCVCGV